MKLDIAILTEAKLTNNIHAKYYQGYRIIATDADSPHKGGIAVIWRGSDNFTIESLRIQGKNTISFELTTGSYSWLVIGTYISPNSEGKTECNEIIRIRLQKSRLPLILTGDFNHDIYSEATTERSQRILDCLSILGVENMEAHFRRRQHFRDGTTWR
jgi:hypothetical protein